MKPENLGNLLYCYIQEKRTYDEVDSPVRPDDQIKDLCLSGGDYENFSASNLPSPLLPPQSPLSAEQQFQVSFAGRKLSKLTDKFFTDQPDRSVVKFKNSCLFVPPEKQTISIPVLRSPGFDDVPLTIKWRTHDKTALCGMHYIGTEGEIILEKGEKEKEILVEILPTKTDGDLRFQMELVVENSFFTCKPLTINIQNISNFCSDEQRAIENLLESSPASASDVLIVLGHMLNNHTFHSGLSYLCSKANSLPLEFGLAFEFSRLCLQSRKLQYEFIFNTLEDFFRDLELPDDF